MRTSPWLLTTGVVLVGAGAALLILAMVTPWHSSEDFYVARDALFARSRSDNRDFEAMSVEFHALQDYYRTNKWRYADLGYLSVVFGLLIVAVLARSQRRMLASSHHRALVSSVFLLAYVAFWGGSVAASYHAYHRRLAPWWADSLAIPVGGAIFGALVFAAPLAALLLWPLIPRATQPKPLWYLNTEAPVSSAFWTLVYAPLAAGFIALAAVLAPSAGSWAATPALAALGWLTLNARVLAIAPRQSLNRT